LLRTLSLKTEDGQPRDPRLETVHSFFQRKDKSTDKDGLLEVDLIAGGDEEVGRG